MPTVLVVGTVATASWAAPGDPIPVKDNPKVTEIAPSAHGAWFGWAQNSQRKPDHYDFFVQRGTEARVKVNAPGTQGLGGDIEGGGVFYAQQCCDRAPRINRFDLSSGLRSPLPAKVNHRRHTVTISGMGRERVVSGVRGDVTVSGPWLLYSGYMEFLDNDVVYPFHTVMLYNRVTHRLRTLTATSSETNDVGAGQVNGKYVTYLRTNFVNHGSDTTWALYRYNIKTGRTVQLTRAQESPRRVAPSVSSDGTSYYFDTVADCTDPCTHELVRRPIGGPAQVIATLTTEEMWERPDRTYVKDRPNGSRLIFMDSNPGIGTGVHTGDIFKVVDGPE